MYLRPLFALLAAGLACALAGCGGGGGSSDSASPGPTGQARFTVLWPPPAASAHGQAGPKLIPAAANSIIVALAGAGAPPAQTLTRPAQGQSLTSTATFTNLPPGAYTASAVAHPNPDGTGVAQAQASAPLTIVAGQTSPLTMTLGSTIASVVVTPNPAPVLFGQTVQLTATAYDGPTGTGNVVLTSAFTWVSSNTALATVDPNTGLVTAAAAGTVAPGSVTITATATEPTPPVNGTGTVNVGTAAVITVR